MFPKNIRKNSNTKFHENPFSGSRVVACGQTDRRTNRQTDGRTDRDDETVTFRNSEKRLKCFSNSLNLVSKFLYGIS